MTLPLPRRLLQRTLNTKKMFLRSDVNYNPTPGLVSFDSRDGSWSNDTLTAYSQCRMLSAGQCTISDKLTPQQRPQDPTQQQVPRTTTSKSATPTSTSHLGKSHGGVIAGGTVGGIVFLSSFSPAATALAPANPRFGGPNSRRDGWKVNWT